ncbi:MAG: hypothetical protein V4580_05150 [Bacteroidota bacterium]
MRTFTSLIFLILILNGCSDNKTDHLSSERINGKFSDSVLWQPIDIKSWENTPAINGRSATEEDVKNGSAIYCINWTDHKPYKLKLPKLAYLIDSETKKKELVVVIQIESTDKDTIAGYKNIVGGFGASLFHELEFLNSESVKALAGN